MWNSWIISLKYLLTFEYVNKDRYSDTGCFGRKAIWCYGSYEGADSQKGRWDIKKDGRWEGRCVRWEKESEMGERKI